MTDAAAGGLAAVVGGRRGHGLALRFVAEQLLAKRGILAALQALDGVLSTAKAQFHGFGILAGQIHGALLAGHCVYVVTEDGVAGLALVSVVEVVPRREVGAVLRTRHQGVDLRPVHIRSAGGNGIPHQDSLATANPAANPHMMRKVVAEAREKGAGRAVVAVVVEHGQLLGSVIGEVLPVDPAQIDAFEQRRDDVAGERCVPDGEGVVAGRRLRAFTVGGDDQGRVVHYANLADGGPFLDLERALDPRHDVLVFGIMKVDPAKGAGGLLGARNCRSRAKDSQND